MDPGASVDFGASVLFGVLIAFGSAVGAEALLPVASGAFELLVAAGASTASADDEASAVAWASVTVEASAVA